VKRTIQIIGILSLSLLLHTQQETHDVTVINIEVPVRVFKGSQFVDNLTIKDFEVYEDGKLQKVEAVYLVKKTNIEREDTEMKKEEARKKFAPQVSRNFVLLFQITEYLPKIGEAIDYFFKNVIMPGDNLTVITPMTTYHLKSKALEALPKEEIIKQLKEKLRKDALRGSAEYRSLLKDLEESISGSPSDEDLQLYRLLLRRLENLRCVDEKKLLEFGDFLKNKEGQKHVFLFYQKEIIPQIDPTALNQLMSQHQDKPHYILMLLELFEFFKRDISFDVNLVKQVFADSSISIHFLFITKTPPQRLSVTSLQPSEVISMVERSEDVYSAFREMAKATGGLTDSSANAASSFKRAVDASENYYLLYYAPKGYKADGKFRDIKVKVKNKNYRITHRAGYFAN